MNKTQIITLAAYGIIVFANATASWATAFSVAETIFAWPGIIGIIIGIIALVKGDVRGWGIHNRGVAIIVIIASFVYFLIITYIFLFLPVFFY